MNSPTPARAPLFLSLVLAASGSAQEPGRAPGVTALAAPAPEGSGMYSLSATSEGAAFLSWVEPAGEGHAFRFSELRRPESDGQPEAAGGDSWGPPRLIAEGAGWFVNWADHPSVAALGGDQLAAHWLVRNPAASGHYGYGLKIAHSADRGASWREVFSEGLDNTDSYSGFVSFAPEPGGFSAAYLTPPPGAKDPGDMTLRLARFHEQGYMLGDQRLDADVCSCCPTAMAAIDGEPVVAYRDRRRNPPEDEVRDIAIARKFRGRWQPGRPVHEDGWRINACPVNGPEIAAGAGAAAVVWFTAASGEPEVRIAFSRDSGTSFDPPLRLDGGAARGFVAIALLDDGSAAVAWLESGSGRRAEVRARRAWPDGRLGPALRVAEAPAGREAGVLQLVRIADEPPAEDPESDEAGESAEAETEDLLFDVRERLLVAWRDGGVRTAVVATAALETR